MKVKINNKLAETKNGVINATEIKRPGGRVDVVIHVPCLQIVGKNQKG